MIAIKNFHFIRPLWLTALLPLILLIWLMIKMKLGSRSWETVCDEALLPYILIRTKGKSKRLAVILVVLGGLLTILSLAGPAWEKLPQPVFTSRSSLVIALDLSRSMDANDVTPSRLERARFKIADILQQRSEGQTALLVYAGDSFVVTPLTDDVETISSQLNALTTDIMPVQGNKTDIAMEMAINLLKQAGVKNGDILLMTDELKVDKTKEQISLLSEQGYRLSILGVGTSHGAPIPLADGSFLKDRHGRIVVPILNEELLREASSLGGGLYHQMTSDDRDLKEIIKLLSGHSIEDDIESTELETDVWREHGPWLVIILLPLIALMFRKGYLVALLIFVMSFPQQAQAMSWRDFWLRPDQQAKRALDSGDIKKAAELFQDPSWKGTAQYQSGNFEAAVETLKQVEDNESLYNSGNSLARLGRYEEAIAAYSKVIQNDLGHEDAIFNKELIEERLEKQQQSQNDQEQQDNKENQDKQDQQDQQNKRDQNKQDQQDNKNQQAEDQQQGQQKQQDSKEQQRADSEQQNSQQQEKMEEEGKEKQQDKQIAQADQKPYDEKQQALEQWLRRIPDDPAGLLRHKFRYQYQQRPNRQNTNKQDW